jgi:hypothetical protein
VLQSLTVELYDPLECQFTAEEQDEVVRRTG